MDQGVVWSMTRQPQRIYKGKQLDGNLYHPLTWRPAWTSAWELNTLLASREDSAGNVEMEDRPR